MELLTVGCVATVVVVAAGVTVYVNRKRRREIAAQERRAADRRQPPVTETRGPFSVNPKTEKVSITGSKVLDTGPQDIARKPAPLERHGRPARSSDRQDPAKRSRDDIAHAARRRREDEEDRRRRDDDSSDLALGMGLGYLAGSSEPERSRDTFSGNGGSFGGGGASSSWGGDSSSSCSSSSDSSSSSSDSGSCSSSD